MKPWHCVLTSYGLDYRRAGKKKFWFDDLIDDSDIKDEKLLLGGALKRILTSETNGAPNL